jgi:hypothetical protein
VGEESNAAIRELARLTKQDEQLTAELAGKELLPYGLGAGRR